MAPFGQLHLRQREIFLGIFGNAIDLHLAPHAHGAERRHKTVPIVGHQNGDDQLRGDEVDVKGSFVSRIVLLQSPALEALRARSLVNGGVFLEPRHDDFPVLALKFQRGQVINQPQQNSRADRKNQRVPQAEPEGEAAEEAVIEL